MLHSPDKLTSVVLCICSANRPKMLDSCLNSVIKQIVPHSWHFQVLVVNNSPSINIDHIISAVQSKTPIEIKRIDEFKLGIPYARNAACQEALRLKADWILMMDDDEEACPDWFLSYDEARKKFNELAYTGPVNYVYPKGYQEWLIEKGKSKMIDGKVLKTAATNNVFFSTQLLKPPFSLSFDIQMAFTGGSDSDFFMRYVRLGGKILAVPLAMVSEVVVPNRLTLSWQLQRQFRSNANRIYIQIKLDGKTKTFINAIREILMRLFHGFLRTLIAPLFLLCGYDIFQKNKYIALRHFAKAGGLLAGLLERHPQPYKSIDGY
jgi:succinoglycan biosynthesis protein ExoM